jgi:hypothetical protein
MRWLLQFTLGLALVLWACEVPAADFKMSDGSVVTGELVAPNDDGTVIRRTSGGLTGRLAWDRFAQDTLVEMAKDEKLKEWVQAFIEVPDSISERVELVVKDPAGKVARPAKRPGLFSAFFSTQAGMFIVLVLMLGNLYAAYEVSIFRNYPAAAVMGTSLILPILGPILFLCMPNRVREDVVLESQFEAPQDVQNTGAQELAAAGLGGSGLSLSAGKHAAPTGTSHQPAVYKRGDVEFNRQFFERTFPLFFRVSRTDSDKDLVLVIKSSKGEVIGTRITRISSGEMGVAALKGHEVQVRFGEISEVQLRPRPA